MYLCSVIKNKIITTNNLKVIGENKNERIDFKNKERN